MVHEKYMSQLLNGIFLPETPEKLLDVVEHMNATEFKDNPWRHGITADYYCCQREGHPGAGYHPNSRGKCRDAIAAVVQADPEKFCKNLEPTIGFEPMTCRLRIDCSTS